MKKIDENLCPKEYMQKHWSKDVVFTDLCLTKEALFLSSNPEDVLSEENSSDFWYCGADVKKVAESELMFGEISAETFKVGCYEVRYAKQIYKIDISADFNEREKLCSKEEAELEIKQNGENSFFNFGAKFRITHKLSAKHISSPKNEFIQICQATESLNWFERIGTIFAAKENISVPDEYSSLLVFNRYCGSSFCSETWYKLSPTGKISTLKDHPYDSDSDNEKLF